MLLALPAHANTPPEDVPIYAVSLVGSPYRLGGTSPETGLDCSGFVGHVFRQTTGILLPRDSLAISEASQPLAQTELRPGDLVFFNTLNRAFSHVGIYLGEDRFVHAASSRTVRSWFPISTTVTGANVLTAPGASPRPAMPNPPRWRPTSSGQA